MLRVPDEHLHDMDATSDGLPRFIYGEYTGETRLPERSAAYSDDDGGEGAKRPMDRSTMILIGSGGVALLFIVGLVIAALNTGGAGETPAAANVESPASAVSGSGVPSPTDSPPTPSPTWAMAPTDVSTGGSTKQPTKTGTTTKPATTPAAPTTKATRTTKPPKTPTKPTIIFPPPR